MLPFTLEKTRQQENFEFTNDFILFRPPKMFINSLCLMTLLGRRNMLMFGLIFHFLSFYLNDRHFFQISKIHFLAKLSLSFNNIFYK